MRVGLLCAAQLLTSALASAQENPETVCGMALPRPAASPPPSPDPITLAMVMCFGNSNETPVIDPQTYLYYIQFRASQPSRGIWVPYDDAAERTLLEDFRRLWATNFLANLSIEALDYTFANGTPGKVIVVRLEERRRVRLVDYEGAERVSRTDIDERFKDKGIELRLDAFLDEGVLRRAAAAIRELYAEKGHQYSRVTPAVTDLPNNPKMAHVVFNVEEGPRVAIRDIEFTGNRAFSDDVLARLVKTNKPRGLISLVTGGGTYNEEKFADDAQLIVNHYRNNGFVEVQVGDPELRALDDSADGKTRWVQLRAAIAEGRRFRVGNVSIEGNTIVKSEALRTLFKITEGEEYREDQIRKGFEKAREIYGAGGYFEFTGFPDLAPRESGDGPVVDVVLRLTEGKQYFIHRIEFAGNSTTRDNVIRRELNIVEGGVFNSEAMKYSVRRLNQLGFFKPLDEHALAVDRVAGTDNKVNVKITVEEQNRNQLTFGAGASQYEGLFGQLSYTTSNFLGKGESVTVSGQAGARSRNYQLSFSEPFLFGRNLTGGGSAYSRKIDYAVASQTIDYSEVRSGFTLTTAMALRRFTRGLVTYGYEVVETAMTDDLRESFDTTQALFLAGDGEFRESSITPTLEYNTVDNPFAPRSGQRFSMSYQYAGGMLGGATHFIKPEGTAIVYVPLTGRTALGFRLNAGKIWNFGSHELPYYQRYFLGGENTIRGVDIRTVGPLNESNVATGGTSFALFNAEYYVDILPQVRALAFHDAGQAFSDSQRFNLRQLRTSSGLELRVTLPVLNVPFRLIYFWNIYRDSFQPARGFKFAVGTTF
jgi:outer membrane protein insertion porin family